MKQNIIIGRNLKSYREINGYTQEQIAKYLKTKRETVSYYETGTREISITILEALSDIYGVEIADFLEEDETNVKETLACEFRTEGLDESDLETIAQFKSIVKNYLKIHKKIKTDDKQ